jgi:alpha-L-fucosidase 2
MLHQNVRLPFYSMNAAGQFDYTQSFIDLYMRGFPIMKEHTKAVFGHDGTVIRESTTLWGVIAPGVYGVNREGLEPGKQESVWHQTHWNAGLEVAWYLSEHYDYTQNETFATDTLIPFSNEIIKFFDVHWPHRDGKLYFPDVHCLESFRKVDNPMPFIAGLMCVIDRLLALPENLTTETDRKYWKEVLARVPEIPTWEYKGKTILANAEVMKSPKVNVEVSELYSIFPYQILGIGKPDLELAQTTYQNRSTLITEGSFKSPGWSKGHLRGGWHPESIMAAMVGLTDSVKMEVIWALNRPVPEQRFPGFFKSTHDGTPDVQHSSVAATALQRMILQDVGNKIVIIPAWPADWNCDFKLYAKQNTIVEGKFINGKIETLKVTPESRKNDVFIGQELNKPDGSIWKTN